MKYFTLNEFIQSDKAKQLKIDNTPSKYQERNIVEMVNNLLDPLREDWGKYCIKHKLGSGAIRVTSGVRSTALNNAVGGSKTSAHYHGYAADLVPYNGNLKEFKKFCIEWLMDKDFDQVIFEEEQNNIPRWIHIGYKHSIGKQRRQFMYSIKGKYYYLNELMTGNYL